MASAPTKPISRVTAVKFVISGGFGVGKTTFIGSISEVKPLTTEAAMTTVSEGIDDTSKVSSKTTTTVAMDFGRITIDEALIVYLFGTPGQDRFGFMWDDIVEGALGGVILVDTRRIDDCFVAIDYFEAREIPFVIGVNHFDGATEFLTEEVREALGLDASVPMAMCDARSKESVKGVLLELVKFLTAQARAGA